MKLKFFCRDERLGFICFIACIFAIALQIQITVFESPTYSGLRVNLADMILPFIGVFIIGSLLLKRSKWPQWVKPKTVYIALTSLFAVMSISLLQGYLTYGQVSNWALINKYIGFIILISYALLGGWLATNTTDKFIYLYFMRVFCGFFILILVLSVISLVIGHLFQIPLWIGDYEWDGFMANRNAFMLIALFSLITIEIYQRSSEKLFPDWVYSLFWALMPFFVIYNASRGFWIIAGAIVLLFFLTRPLRFLKRCVPFILIGSALCFGLISLIGVEKSANFKQFVFMQSLIDEDRETYLGDQRRLIAIEDGLELYRQSNSITGAGLGMYHEFQTEKRAEFIDIIDFTALWLLVETGGLGLLVFTSFLCLCLWIFYQQGFKDKSAFHRSLFFFLFAFVAASFLHEITYTRFIWLMLGLGLVSLHSSNLKKA